MQRRPTRSRSARRPPPQPTTSARSRERLRKERRGNYTTNPYIITTMLMTTNENLPRNTIYKEKE
jgi:hypothetical protein